MDITIKQEDMMTVFNQTWKQCWTVAEIPKEYLADPDRALGSALGMIRAINLLGWHGRFKIYCQREVKKLKTDTNVTKAEVVLMTDFIKDHFDDTFYI